MIVITIRQCVYLFYDICPVIFVIFVIYHVTVYSLSLGLRTNTLARLSMLFLSILHTITMLNYTPVGHGGRVSYNKLSILQGGGGLGTSLEQSRILYK